MMDEMGADAFLCGGGEQEAVAASEANLREAFRIYDADRNGLISARGASPRAAPARGQVLLRRRLLLDDPLRRWQRQFGRVQEDDGRRFRQRHLRHALYDELRQIEKGFVLIDSAVVMCSVSCIVEHLLKKKLCGHDPRISSDIHSNLHLRLGIRYTLKSCKLESNHITMDVSIKVHMTSDLILQLVLAGATLFFNRARAGSRLPPYHGIVY
ncbi:hypothetical protein EJB05_17438, partial [Eragrostis curvula]